MSAQSSFDYAVIRVVPRVDREEFVNAGVIVFCLEKNFLGAKVSVNEERLKALWPEIDVALIRRHLEAFPKISAGDSDAGPIGQLTLRERFHWLVSPRSTMIQVSPVHTGICGDPQQSLDRLFERLTC
ncbi:DUF3037 domain-containing protein [Acidobacterium sp. S8]|uniref:DUF3037 domain-containing protein n=1 Tax=Acidobacterium sp. S8 TaxID=1641854 RepID=UPI00131CF162|nr:DUF3037 domain-containing protein [Acidobacterium sp. S8]